MRQLRSKYAELTDKYTKLVELVEGRARQPSALFHLGSWGLEVRGTALLLVNSGKIVFTNEGFTEFADIRSGRWVESGGARSYTDLRRAVLDHARSVERSEEDYRAAVLRHDQRDVYLKIKAQRGRGGDRYVAVLIEDITEEAQRDHELVRTREALVQRERLRVLGELAAAVAHDLANTLRGASFELAALKGKMDGSLAGVARRVEIASQLVGQLHDFARGGSIPTADVKLDEIIEQAVALAEIELRESLPEIRIEISVPRLPAVRGSGAELSLLFVNLLRNARDAMPEGGTVAIQARMQGDDVLVAVEDEGIGIAAANLPRMFQPFFTTKGSQGAGLGLWLARGTMSRLGGSIDVVNRERKGARFSLRFPLADEISPPRPAPARARGSRGRRSPASRQSGRARRTGGRTSGA